MHDGHESILLRGGRVIDPARGLAEARDVLIQSGRISLVSAEIAPERGGRVIDVSGMVVVPGFVDLRAHLREPGNEGDETIETGAMAAARGGFSTVLCAANTKPVIDDPSIVRFIRARAAQACGTRIRPLASVTRGRAGKELTDFGSLRDSGAAGFSDAPGTLRNAATLRRALESARDLGAVIIEQCQDDSLTGSGVMHEGPVSVRLGLHGIPRTSESTVVARDAMLALATGGRLHISQVSNFESVETIRQFKARGAPITAEVSPHHLTMTDEAVGAGAGPYNTNAKVLPPLCEERDRRALVEALEDGTIDCIATCHAPHRASSKDNVFDAAPFGIIGFESAFAVLHAQFVASGRWTLEFLIEKLTAAPASVLGEAGRLGTMVPGLAADIAVLDVGEPYTFDRSLLASRSRNCPWLGETMSACVVLTLVDGRPTWDERGLFADFSFSGLGSTGEAV